MDIDLDQWPVIDLRVLPEDPQPYWVQVPRVPCVGEKFTGPDDSGTFFVTEVRYVYERGFASVSIGELPRVVVEVGLEP